MTYTGYLSLRIWQTYNTGGLTRQRSFHSRNWIYFLLLFVNGEKYDPFSHFLLFLHAWLIWNIRIAFFMGSCKMGLQFTVQYRYIKTAGWFGYSEERPPRWVNLLRQRDSRKCERTELGESDMGRIDCPLLWKNRGEMTKSRKEINEQSLQCVGVWHPSS